MIFSESLKKDRDFKQVYRKGRSVADRYIVLYSLPNGTDRNRIGISASKKIGNSVVRHHFARLIREAYRLHERMFTGGVDMVVVARAAAAEATYAELAASLMKLAGKSHLTQNSESRCGG
ncbi:MAG: ribonuclease P protein component [Butyrivibrio sp.]|nr:ribonuclease P protein component [Butyrivibrio sp.]